MVAIIIDLLSVYALLKARFSIPYSAKFSRCIIFAVLEDWFETAKIKLAKFFLV